MAEHLGDGFDGDAVSQSYCGAGVTCKVKNESPFDTAHSGDPFDLAVQFSVTIHWQLAPVRCGIAVFVEDMQRQVEQRKIVVDLGFLAFGFDPYRPVFGGLQIVLRQTAHIPVGNACIAGKRKSTRTR